MDYKLWEGTPPYFEPSYGQAEPSITPYLCEGGEKRGAVIICPGGAYVGRAEHEGRPIAKMINEAGVHAFVLNYRVTPYHHPVELEDALRAIKYVRYHSPMFNVDPYKIAIMGFSAGGHLTAHYCNRYDCPEVRQVFPESKPVNACVLGYPVITADPRYSHKGSFEKLNGGTYPEEEKQDFYSCEKMVSEKTPPTFLWHCTGDKVVPVKNSLLYADALAEHGVPFQMHIYPGAKHGLGTADKTTNAEIKPDWEQIKDWLPALHKWLQQTLQTEY